MIVIIFSTTGDSIRVVYYCTGQYKNTQGVPELVSSRAERQPFSQRIYSVIRQNRGQLGNRGNGLP